MIHETAENQGLVAGSAKVWQYAHVRECATVGNDSVVARGAYIDHGVHVGNNCKIGNYACVYWPASVANGVFIGPHAVLTNDKHPRAVNEDGSIKSGEDWCPQAVVVAEGASIGARAVILAGVRIGAGAMIGAGSVVTKDVPDGETWAGNPAIKIDVDK